jgi:hypothetical protein
MAVLRDGAGNDAIDKVVWERRVRSLRFSHVLYLTNCGRRAV